MSVIHAVVQVNDLLALMIFEVLDFEADDQFLLISVGFGCEQCPRTQTSVL